MNYNLVISVIAVFSIGVINAFPDARIVNGELVAETQFPWHTSIHVNRQHTTTAYIGGSIISPNFILTTAKFLSGAQSATVQMGSTAFSTPLVTVESQKFFIHPNYNPVTSAYDIALIQLPYNLQFNNYIQPIRLPTRSQSSNKFAGANGLISGFGVTSDGKNNLKIFQWDIV